LGLGISAEKNNSVRCPPCKALTRDYTVG